MNTRYTPLVKLKKSTMDKSERVVQQANADLNSASMALQISYNSLDDIDMPNTGTMSAMLASRSLLTSQRSLIQNNQEWVSFAKNQVFQAKENLKKDMIEFEKFKYLELQEIKEQIKKQKIQDAKDLDEVALMTFSNNEKRNK